MARGRRSISFLGLSRTAVPWVLLGPPSFAVRAQVPRISSV